MNHFKDNTKEKKIVTYWRRSEIELTAKVNVKVYPMKEATVPTESKPCKQ
jgi:hypothetical protein